MGVMVVVVVAPTRPLWIPACAGMTGFWSRGVSRKGREIPLYARNDIGDVWNDKRVFVG